MVVFFVIFRHVCSLILTILHKILFDIRIRKNPNISALTNIEILLPLTNSLHFLCPKTTVAKVISVSVRTGVFNSILPLLLNIQ